MRWHPWKCSGADGTLGNGAEAPLEVVQRHPWKWCRVEEVSQGRTVVVCSGWLVVRESKGAGRMATGEVVSGGAVDVLVTSVKAVGQWLAKTVAMVAVLSCGCRWSVAIDQEY